MSQSDVVIRRRSTVEMDIAILQALSGSTLLKMTHIMYKANLNASVLKEKLVVLEARGLIRSHKLHKDHIKHSGKDRMFYGATSKGLEVLHSYLSAYSALGSVE
jgi:predicted transcriptional regulator